MLVLLIMRISVSISGPSTLNMEGQLNGTKTKCFGCPLVPSSSTQPTRGVWWSYFSYGSHIGYLDSSEWLRMNSISANRFVVEWEFDLENEKWKYVFHWSHHAFLSLNVKKLFLEKVRKTFWWGELKWCAEVSTSEQNNFIMQQRLSWGGEDPGPCGASSHALHRDLERVSLSKVT